MSLVERINKLYPSALFAVVSPAPKTESDRLVATVSPHGAVIRDMHVNFYQVFDTKSPLGSQLLEKYVHDDLHIPNLIDADYTFSEADSWEEFDEYQDVLDDDMNEDTETLDFARILPMKYLSNKHIDSFVKHADSARVTVYKSIGSMTPYAQPAFNAFNDQRKYFNHKPLDHQLSESLKIRPAFDEMYVFEEESDLRDYLRAKGYVLHEQLHSGMQTSQLVASVTQAIIDSNLPSDQSTRILEEFVPGDLHAIRGLFASYEQHLFHEEFEVAKQNYQAIQEYLIPIIEELR